MFHHPLAPVVARVVACAAVWMSCTALWLPCTALWLPCSALWLPCTAAQCVVDRYAGPVTAQGALASIDGFETGPSARHA